MGLFSHFRSAPELSAAAPERPAMQGLWRRGDFSTVPMGAAEHAVRRRGQDARLLPSFVVEFLYGCEEFRPLEQQVRLFAEHQGWESMQLDALREYLPMLVEEQLLVSPETIRTAVQARANSVRSATQLSSLGLVTGGERWPMVERCLQSFHENLRRHGRTTPFLVSDNSTEVAAGQRCREYLQEWQRASGAEVWFAAEAEKRSFADALVKAGACPPEVVEFALFDPLNVGFSCGANRNALLLQEAGRLFCSLDDDIICRLTAAPTGADSRLAVTSDTDPYSRWLFATRAEVQALGGAGEKHDFVGEHERLLGCTAADLLGRGGEADYRQAGDAVVRRLLRQPACVRATFLGQAGDPGIPSSAYYLYYKRANRERLTASEAAYASYFPSRNVVALSPTPSIGDPTVSPGMAMGLDHRTLLPPFFPVMHAEDYSFGAALWQCCPESLLGHLPFAVAHEPPEGKPILAPAQMRSQRPFVTFEFAHLLRRLILRLDLPEAATATQRMTQLGRFVAELGQLPSADFHDMLRLEALGEATARLTYLNRLVAEETDAPDYWRTDVEAFADRTREALAQPGSEIPLDLPSARTAEENRGFIQRALLEYGRLLQHWPTVVEAAKGLREHGHGLMRPLQ